MHALRRIAESWLGPLSLVALLAGGWAFLRAQDAPDASRLRAHLPTIGEHSLIGQEEGHGVSPIVAPALLTQQSGSALLAFNAGYASNDLPPKDTYGNRWKQLGGRVVYRGYDNRFDVKAYLAMPAKGGPGHTVSIEKTGNPAGELTLPFIEIRNADVLQDVAQNYPPLGPEITSGNVTTTGPATLIAVWWGDGPFKQNQAEPQDGFTVIERFVRLPEDSAVQCVVAYKDVDRAGTYHVTWTNAPPQSAPLWLFAFQSRGATASTGSAHTPPNEDGASAIDAR